MGEKILKDPEVTPFVECPNCLRLLECGAARCPSCYEEIVEDYALLSAAAVSVNTRAVSTANTIGSIRPSYLLPSLLIVLAYDVLEAEAPALIFFSLTWPVPALIAIAVWFVKYNWFKIGDADFIRARREMGSLLWRWLAFLAVQLVILSALWE